MIYFYSKFEKGMWLDVFVDSCNAVYINSPVYEMLFRVEYYEGMISCL